MGEAELLAEVVLAGAFDCGSVLDCVLEPAVAEVAGVAAAAAFTSVLEALAVELTADGGLLTVRLLTTVTPGAAVRAISSARCLSWSVATVPCSASWLFWSRLIVMLLAAVGSCCCNAFCTWPLACSNELELDCGIAELELC